MYNSSREYGLVIMTYGQIDWSSNVYAVGALGDNPYREKLETRRIEVISETWNIKQ